MSWREFIFSNKRSHKLRRHFVFWVVYGIQYYLQSIIPVDRMFYSAFVSAYCFLPACVISVYTLTLVLLPVLRARKFLIFSAGLISLAGVLVIVNYYMSVLFFSLTCNCEPRAIPFSTILGLNLGNTAHAVITGCLVLGFKIAKDWMARQKENQTLLNQKISNELRLQKARIYPRFLIQSMTNLQEKLRDNSEDSPEIILKLSDVLSYLLYESSEESVPVEREIEMVESYLAIEELIHPHRIVIHKQTTLHAGQKLVRPLVLFQIIQQCCENIGYFDDDKLTLDLIFDAMDDGLHVRLLLIQSDTPAIKWKALLERLHHSLMNIAQLGRDVTYKFRDLYVEIDMHIALNTAP